MSYVLVVEDDALAAGAAEEVLASFGHTVRVVPDPAAAVRELFWQRPDVVLAGLRLPPYDDRVLPAVCDRLAIPLMDLLDAICLMGASERRPRADLREALATRH